MKSLLLIAALVAAPAFAQTTPTDPSMQQPMPAPAGQPMGTMTPGGYQPAMPAMQGTMTPGVTPTFQAAPTPAQAYPAPAALASYPPCKPGQFDQCMQVAGSTHAKKKHHGM